ncbi:MAG: lipopolysaccharide transport periplasmic protein LptA [Gammaproteobacteria bacterium]
MRAGLLLALTLLAPHTARAASDDINQLVEIEADTATLDDKNGTSTYTGNVRITQGTMVLTGDKVSISAVENQLDKIIAEGELATFRQLTDDGRELNAEARRMEYHSLENRILLLGAATLRQAENSFSSERIQYNTETEIVNAGEPGGGNRVRMTIAPRSIPKSR